MQEECAHQWEYQTTQRAQDWHNGRPISRAYKVRVFACRACGARRDEVVDPPTEAADTATA